MRNEIKRLPAEFLERLRLLFPVNKFDDMANTFCLDRPTTFRVNTLKKEIPVIYETLTQAGFRLEKVSWCPGAFILRNRSLRDLQSTESYRQGEIYVQSLPSMVPPLVLAPEPGETVLDLTAAPGSKTTQMAVMMQGKGRLVANDNNKIRFFKLKANVEQQGAVQVELSMQFGESFGKKFPDTFDRVLLDAPCSAEGRFSTHEPSSYRFWKAQKIKEMCYKQKKLFAAAFQALKPGGRMVYSTCTFAPEENESVLNWALETFPGQLEIESFRLPFHNQREGLREWQGRVFHETVRKAVRIIPNQDMEGFFVARVSKKKA